MAFTELVAIGGTSPSTERVIASGVRERVGIKFSGPITADHCLEIQVKDDAGGWQRYSELRGGSNTTELLDGPVTYRVKPLRGGAGAYVEA